MSDIYPPTQTPPPGATGLPDLGSLPVYQNRQFLDSLWTAAEQDQSPGLKAQMEINRQNTNSLRANDYLPGGWTRAGIINQARQRAPMQNSASNIQNVTASTPSQPVPAPVQTVSPPSSSPQGFPKPMTDIFPQLDTWGYFMNGGAG